MRPLLTSFLAILAACSPDTPVPTFEDGLLPGEVALDAMSDGLWAPPPPLSSCTASARVFDAQRSYPSLVDAMANAPAGETLHVCPGTHVGPFLRYSGWPLAVAGMTGDPDDTRLEGPPGEHAFWFNQNSEELTLTGVTIASGNGEYVIVNAVDAIFDLQNCVLEGGGMTLFRGRSLRMRDTIVRRSAKQPIVDMGVAIVGEGIDPDTPITAILENVIIEDQVGQWDQKALGVNTFDHPAGTYVLVRDSIIRGTISESHAAVSLGLSNTWVRFDGTDILDNHATDPIEGLGVLSVSTHNGTWARLDLFDVTVADNSAAGAPIMHATYSIRQWRPRDPRPTIHIRDSRFYRNLRTGQAPIVPSFYFNDSFLVYMDNVDFGTGVNTNAAPEFAFCQSTDPGIIPYAEMDRIAWHVSPPCP